MRQLVSDKLHGRGAREGGRRGFNRQAGPHPAILTGSEGTDRLLGHHQTMVTICLLWLSQNSSPVRSPAPALGARKSPCGGAGGTPTQLISIEVSSTAGLSHLTSH